MFGDIFGGTPRRRRGRAAAASTAGRPVLLARDLARGSRPGSDTQIRIPTWESCGTCGGTGAKPGTSPKTCSHCNGSGTVHMRQGFFSIQQTCPHCRGSGKIIPDPCGSCNGAGKVKKTKTLEVKIPAGINEGMRIRSAGNGEPGTNGGPPGDLYIEIHGSSRTRSSSATATTCTARCRWADHGGAGRRHRGADAGRQGGDRTARGHAARQDLPPARQGHQGPALSYPGDLYCHVSVETPVKLTEHQRKLLKELDESFRKAGDRHSPNAKSWTDRVKDLFK
jgi:molecular chaperone DnaJ